MRAFFYVSFFRNSLEEVGYKIYEVGVFINLICFLITGTIPYFNLKICIFIKLKRTNNITNMNHHFIRRSSLSLVEDFDCFALYGYIKFFILTK